MAEVWKDIEGYEGLYHVSNLGRVKSLKFNKIRVLKPFKGGTGYLKVQLYRNNIQTNYAVHRLVAQAFIPNPEKKPEVNHINEIKADNRVENLEWMTFKENCNYGTRNQRVSKSNKNNPKRSNLVNQYDLEWNLIASYESASEATRQTGIARSSISDVCLSKRRTAGGFRWRYLKEDE